jgi:protoporphyrinogen oxidase
MGLAVAYEMVKQGVKVDLYEAGPEIGGMAATFHFSGVNIERYYHFHCTSDLDFLALLEELNLGHEMTWTSTKMAYWHPGLLQQWGDPISLLRFQGLSFVAKVRYGLFAFVSTRRNNWTKLDKENAVTWVQKWVGREAYQKLWAPLFSLKFYELSDNLSAAWIWSRIRRIGRSRYSLFREKLGHLHGGSDTLLRAMRAYIESNGSKIHLRSRVERIEFDGIEAVAVHVNGVRVVTNAVISTAPMPYIASMLEVDRPELANSYRNFQNIGVVCVIAKIRESVSPYFWVNTVDPNMDIPGVIEYSNLNKDLSETIVYVPFYMPTTNQKYSDDDSVFVEKTKRYLQQINRGLKNEDFIDVVVSRYKFAQPICEPQFLDRIPPVRPGNENLWIADTSFYYPEDRGISESVGFGRRIGKECASYLEGQ